MVRYLAALLLLASTAANSTTVTLDFEEFYGEVALFDSVTNVITQNYRVTAPPGDAVWFPDPPFGGTVSIIAESLTVQAINGQAFDLLSFDYSFNGDLETRDIDVSVITSLGQTNTYNLSVLGDYGRATYDAMGQFNDIVSFTIINGVGNTNLALDDFVVTAAVPVPAAVWLFGSALAGLGWIRRKQTA